MSKYSERAIDLALEQTIRFQEWRSTSSARSEEFYTREEVAIANEIRRALYEHWNENNTK